MSDTQNAPSSVESTFHAGQSSQPALRLLGQEFFYPQSIPAAVSLCFIMAALCLAIAIIYVWSNPKAQEHVERMFKVNAINAVGSTQAATDITTGGRYEFWAPSPQTYRDQEPPSDHQWQKGITPEKVAEFEARLDAYCHGHGWRRFNDYGKGSTLPKEGYWYAIVVEPNFKVEDFAEFYRKFWNTTSPVFAEHVFVDAEYYRLKK